MQPCFPWQYSPSLCRLARTNFAVGLTAGSKGEAQAQAKPVAPATISATCFSSSAKEIVVSWSAVTHASTYTVLRATALAGPYTSVATGVAGLTTTETLANDNYWFEVEAVFGTNWTGTPSSASAETTIQSGTTECKQP